MLKADVRCWLFLHTQSWFTSTRDAVFIHVGMEEESKKSHLVMASGVDPGWGKGLRKKRKRENVNGVAFQLQL